MHSGGEVAGDAIAAAGTSLLVEEPDVGAPKEDVDEAAKGGDVEIRERRIR